MVEKPRTSEAQEIPKSEFVVKLERLWAKGNFVCVGLDSNWNDLPETVRNLGREEGTFIFNRETADHVVDLVCAIKPNGAFYEDSPEGERALERTVAYIHDKYPQIPVIGDNKVADIGNTNLGYVRKLFDRYKFDAVTVHPDLGSAFFKNAGELQLEALRPFLERKDKETIVLVRTSNQSAGEFQDLPIDLTKLSEAYRKKFGDMDELRQLVGKDVVPLYQIMAYRVWKYWNVNGNCAVVVGATYPEELAQIRRIVGDMPILIPGIGAQGGEVEATVNAGKDSRGWGMMINSSRGIIFASKGEDYAEAAREVTKNLREEINQYR